MRMTKNKQGKILCLTLLHRIYLSLFCITTPFYGTFRAFILFGFSSPVSSACCVETELKETSISDMVRTLE